MGKFGKSQPVKRVEDHRFLTGDGRYVDDIAPEGALHGVVFRAPVAQGVITELDVSDAREAEGIHAVLTCADLEAAGINIALPGTVVENRDGSEGAKPLRPMLARDRVRYVGEPVALIVAETLQQARDAAEMILFDAEDLPAKMDLAPGGETIHPEAPDNRAFDWHMGDEAAVEAAFAKARDMMASGDYDLVVMDEINIALRYDYLKVEDVIAGLEGRTKGTTAVLTGRDAKPELCDYADLVTEMREVKHPFHSGIKAQRGVDF